MTTDRLLTPHALLSIEIRHLGGALARQAPCGGALAKIDANYALFATGVTPTSELGDTVRAHVQALKDALRVWRADHDYYNFVETPAEAHVAFPRASYQRLREIKASYDPDQVIISTHPVRPAGR
jgi:berberine-like enzyme